MIHVLGVLGVGSSSSKQDIPERICVRASSLNEEEETREKKRLARPCDRPCSENPKAPRRHHTTYIYIYILYIIYICLHTWSRKGVQNHRFAVHICIHLLYMYIYTHRYTMKLHWSIWRKDWMLGHLTSSEAFSPKPWTLNLETCSLPKGKGLKSQALNTKPWRSDHVWWMQLAIEEALKPVISRGTVLL